MQSETRAATLSVHLLYANHKQTVHRSAGSSRMRSFSRGPSYRTSG